MPKSDCFLLDTHLWIWLLNGDPRIQRSDIFLSITKASRKNELHLSSISIWEVAMLEAKERISFATDLTSWIHDALSAPGLKVVQLLPEISIDSTHLPGRFHGDPADRIIVATARFLKCPLITMDKKILEYAAQGYLNAVSL
jgi:PIN domain nuclease of toxin-antitoxin system